MLLPEQRLGMRKDLALGVRGPEPVVVGEGTAPSGDASGRHSRAHRTRPTWDGGAGTYLRAGCAFSRCHPGSAAGKVEATAKGERLEQQAPGEHGLKHSRPPQRLVGMDEGRPRS